MRTFDLSMPYSTFVSAMITSFFITLQPNDGNDTKITFRLQVECRKLHETQYFDEKI